MKTTRRAVIVLLALAAMGMWSTPASAGPWSQPSGSADDFTYASGGDLSGYFGEPLVAGNTFYFINSNFQVNAVNDGTDTVSDIVSVDVTTNPGWQFTGIQVFAFGTYSVVGDGSQVILDAGLTIHELGGQQRTWSGPLASTPPFPLTFGGIYPNSGDWNGDSNIDVLSIFPGPDSQLHLSLSNLLSAIAGPNGAAEINSQYEQLAITLLPEPASLALLAVGAVLLVRRRR